MSLSKKIVWSTTLILALLFSLGASFMILQNHQRMLSNALQQNITTHRSLTFSLDSKLLQDSVSKSTMLGANEAAMKQRALYYIDQMQKQIHNSQVSYFLYDAEDTLIYQGESMESTTSNFINTKECQLIKINHQPRMIIASSINAGNTTLTFTSCYNLSSIYQERTHQFQTFLLIDGIMLMTSYVALRFLSAYVTKPIQTLNYISREIAQGNYQQRTNIRGEDEIGELSRSFDEMAEINERTIQALQQNIEQMEAFMGSFSHEIKTPMTAIIGFADMLRSYQCDTSTIHTSAQFIFTEGKRLEDLSYQMMELLSLSSTEIKKEAIPISFILAQLQDYYHERTELSFQLKPCHIIASTYLIFTLLRNLIDNACKANVHQLPIMITGQISDAGYLIQVVDQGIGMSEEQLSMATQPFYMADTSRKREKNGAGLGLAICKRICEAHQTTLHMVSKHGQGTTVSFTLEVSK